MLALVLVIGLVLGLAGLSTGRGYALPRGWGIGAYENEYEYEHEHEHEHEGTVG